MEAQDFLSKYSLKKKIAFVVTGGGTSVSELLQVPGSSSVVNSVYIPYSFEEAIRFYNDCWGMNKKVASELVKAYMEKTVSRKVAENLCCSGMERWDECLVVSCTASLTTNRYRRGKNEAYIGIGSGNAWNTYHLELEKLTLNDFQNLGQGFAAHRRLVEEKKIQDFIFEKIIEVQSENWL